MLVVSVSAVIVCWCIAVLCHAVIVCWCIAVLCHCIMCLQYTFCELLDIVQASEMELRQALVDLKACVIHGK